MFLTNYQPRFDIIFMDIEMPYINGLESAEKLRQSDKGTLLIFTTNLGHVAAKGYEVEAFDFVVKPLHYESLYLKLNRAVARLALRIRQSSEQYHGIINHKTGENVFSVNILILRPKTAPEKTN